MLLWTCVCVGCVVIPFWGNPLGEGSGRNVSPFLQSCVVSIGSIFTLSVFLLCLLWLSLWLFLSFFFIGRLLLCQSLFFLYSFLLLFSSLTVPFPQFFQTVGCVLSTTRWHCCSRHNWSQKRETEKAGQKVRRGERKESGSCPWAWSVSTVNLGCSNI